MGKEVAVPRQPGCWLRSSHAFKECVTAHWPSAYAPKINGAKAATEASDSDMVGERSVVMEVWRQLQVEVTEERMLA